MEGLKFGELAKKSIWWKKVWRISPRILVVYNIRYMLANKVWRNITIRQIRQTLVPPNFRRLRYNTVNQIILPVLVASYKWTLVTTIYPQDSGLSKFQVTFGSIAITLLNQLSVQYPLPYCFCHGLYNCHLWEFPIPGTTCPLLMIMLQHIHTNTHIVFYMNLPPTIQYMNNIRKSGSWWHYIILINAYH